MRKALCILCAGAAALLIGQSDASAQCAYGGYGRGIGIGYGAPAYGFNYSRFSNPRSSLSISFGRYPAYRGYGYGGLRQRGHYDYHPPRVVPHGNHYDYIPGHYHWHRGRHW